MRRNTVYLEAADRTQDLLNIKWALRSAGYTIASIWHDSDRNAPCSTLKNHWRSEDFDRLRKCDMLIVLSGQTVHAAIQIALMAGFALARGIEVSWIGQTAGYPNLLPGIKVFDTADEFRTHILKVICEQATTPEQLAA